MNFLLGGSTFIRNAIEFDYPVEATIRSLLHCCDRVVVLDCESNDGTTELLQRLKLESGDRLHLYPFPFTLPAEGHRWLLKAINHARIILMGMGCEWHLQLDGDEVVHEDDATKIRDACRAKRPQFLYRRNFWGSPDRQLADDKVCGTWVARLAQTTVPNVSDEPYPRHRTPLARLISHRDGIELFHYGFCRNREKFFRKAKLMERSYFGHSNPAWDTLAVEDQAGFMAMQPDTFEFNGSHPSFVREWLEKRGQP